jgi:Tfp pilus assembly protein PilV
VHHDERERTSDAGSSLLEVLLAVLLLSLVVSGLLTAMLVSIRISALHRDRVEIESVLVSSAERLKSVAKVPCAVPTDASYLAAARAAATAKGWDGSTVQITSIQYWDGTTYGGTCYDNATNGLPLQQITLRATSPRGKVIRNLTLVKGVG